MLPLLALLAGAQPAHHARALGRLPVRAEPAATAPRIGWIAEDAVFAWIEPADGPDCESTHWARLVGGGFACLTSTEPTEDGPEPLPERVVFDPPEPSEWEDYLESGTWARDPATEEALLPYVYGKRWRQWKGALYADLDAWNAGEEPIGKLSGGGGRKNHFVAVHETERGAVLERIDGSVAPISETHVYPVDRFAGRDLLADPVVEGWLPGWIIDYQGTELLDEPGGVEAAHLGYHAPVEVRAVDDRWWAVRNGLGEGVHGYTDDQRSMHHWVPLDAPGEVGADELWVDIDLGQQVLALRRGEALEYVTLISGGLTGRTPTGTHRVLDKSIHDDMASQPGAADAYLVEEVPWVIHFQPRYAIHGAFWHWGFGHRASHGCVNLAPRDARHVFDAVGPILPDGWHTVLATEANPGTLVRLR